MIKFLKHCEIHYNMKISEIEVGQRDVELEAQVTDVSPVREFTKFGRTGRVANATLQDDSGTIQLTLWDDQINLVKKDDKVKISKGYVKEWQGEKQLSVGRYGNLEVLND